MDDATRDRDDEAVNLETRGVGAEMVAQGVLALALGAAPVHAFLTTLAPLAARALDASARELTGKRFERVESMLEAATEAAGSDEMLAAAIATSDETQELAYDTAEAAARSRVPEAVVAMGRALARGLLSDGTRLDGTRLIIEALASLQPPQVRVLAAVHDHGGMTNWALQSSLDDWRDLLPRLFASLQREGLIVQREAIAEQMRGKSGESAQTWVTTKLGADALRLLNEVGAE